VLQLHSVAVPKGTSGVSTNWPATEPSTATESTPVLGQLAGTPKLWSAFCEVSRQLILQSNAEQVLQTELRNAAAAALDTAILQRSCASGQPLGIGGTSGVGGFTGAATGFVAMGSSCDHRPPRADRGAYYS